MKKLERIDVPQANNLHTVCNLLALLGAGIKSKAALASQLGIVERQLEYYTHAARILGFTNSEDGESHVTETGREYLAGERPDEKQRVLAAAVRRAEVFQELLSEFRERDLDKERVTSFLMRRTGLNRTTARRRADTIIAWLKQTSGQSAASNPF